jgi:hypothetical protein
MPKFTCDLIPIVSYDAEVLRYKGKVCVVAQWEGNYFEVRDAIEEMAPRLFTGSGTSLDGASPTRDISFECKNMKSAIRLMNKLLKWKERYKENKVNNFTLKVLKA